MSFFPKKGGRVQNGKKGGRHQKGKERGRQNRKLADKKQEKKQLGLLQQIKAKSIIKDNNKDEPKELSEFEKLVQSCYVEWWISHVKLGMCEIQDAPDWIKEDKRVAQSSIKANPWSIQFLKSFWSDIEMVSMAVSIRPAVLECLPRHWRNNQQVMKIAFESSMISYKYLGKRLTKLPGFELLLKYEDKYGLGLTDFGLDLLDQGVSHELRLGLTVSQELRLGLTVFGLELLDQEVSHELMKHDGFLLFLAGTRNQSLLISKLGGHSGLLKRKIFEFVGVPFGELLWALQTAKKHIKAGLKR